MSLMGAPVGSVRAITPKCDLSVCPEVKELTNSFEMSGNYCILKGKTRILKTQIFIAGIS